MGKIKSKLIKRAADKFMEEDVGFSSDFDFNKKVLGNTMPSKKVRNQLAGYLARRQRMQEQKEAEMAAAQEAAA